MKETKLYRSLMKLMSDLRPMPWNQRIDHIWSCYRMQVLLIGFCLLILWGMLGGLLTENKDSLLSGVLANVPISDAGKTYLEEAYLVQAGGNPENQEATVCEVTFTTSDNPLDIQLNYKMATVPLSMVQSQDVDYFLMDQEALGLYISLELFTDLRELFPEEELTELADRVIYCLHVDEEGQPTVGEEIPVAIDISNTDFVQVCVNSGEPVYIGFVDNAPNKDKMSDFWYYLLNWKSE